MDEAYLAGTYFSDVGRIADTSLDYRNRFIEWAHGIIVAVLFGALIAKETNVLLGWLASAFVALVSLPFFTIAVIEHGYFVRYNAIRRAILEAVSASADEKPARLEYAQYLVRECDIKRGATEARKRIIRDVLMLGFLYLIGASLVAFAWLSWDVLGQAVPTGLGVEGILLLSVNPPVLNTQGVLRVIVVVVVMAVLGREVRYLLKTDLLSDVVIKTYAQWKGPTT